jgi:hypothetical protein
MAASRGLRNLMLVGNLDSSASNPKRTFVYEFYAKAEALLRWPFFNTSAIFNTSD